LDVLETQKHLLRKRRSAPTLWSAS
jgi:hypothetical protein